MFLIIIQSVANSSPTDFVKECYAVVIWVPMVSYNINVQIRL